MKRLTFWLLLTALVLSCTKNSPPIIESLIAEPDSVFTGDTVTLIFSTSDADNDEIVSSFFCDQGTWIPDDPIKGIPPGWKAPEEPGDYYLILKVSDLTVTVEDSVKVHVMNSIRTFTDDRDGLQYKYVRIGQQIWMAENLAYLPEVFPPKEGGYDARFYYVQGYDGHSVSEAVTVENYRKYGVLYNLKALQTACPSGWYLPSDSDWSELEEYLGMDVSELEESGYRTSGNVGKKIKSTSDWYESGNGNNSSGLNVFPGGSRNGTGEFGGIGTRATFRTGNAGGSTFNFSRGLSFDNDGTNRGTATHNLGLSVRCLKK